MNRGRIRRSTRATAAHTVPQTCQQEITNSVAVAVPDSGFAYLPGTANPFSNGVVTLPGYASARVRLRKALPPAEGLAFAAAYLATRSRPLAAFAVCELRSPHR